MAKKFSDLPSLTTPDSGDQFAVVDISAGTSKKTTMAGLAAGLPVGSVTADKLAAQQAWQTMTPVTGTATYALGYYKDSLGVVRLKGVLNMSGTGTFFTLPAGYRPSQYSEWVTASGGALAAISISDAGVCTKIVGSNGNLLLDGITFRAA